MATSMQMTAAMTPPDMMETLKYLATVPRPDSLVDVDDEAEADTEAKTVADASEAPRGRKSAKEANEVEEEEEEATVVCESRVTMVLNGRVWLSLNRRSKERYLFFLSYSEFVFVNIANGSGSDPSVQTMGELSGSPWL